VKNHLRFGHWFMDWIVSTRHQCCRLDFQLLEAYVMDNTVSEPSREFDRASALARNPVRDLSLASSMNLKLLV